jgi:hypothetical protein
MKNGMENCGCGGMHGCGNGMGRGGCCGNDEAEHSGMGMHRGMGGGMGGKRFMGMDVAPSNKHMAEKLKYYKEDLEEEIKMIEKRIADLEKEEGEKSDDEKD